METGRAQLRPGEPSVSRVSLSPPGTPRHGLNTLAASASKTRVQAARRLCYSQNLDPGLLKPASASPSPQAHLALQTSSSKLSAGRNATLGGSDRSNRGVQAPRNPPSGPRGKAAAPRRPVTGTAPGAGVGRGGRAPAALCAGWSQHSLLAARTTWTRRHDKTGVGETAEHNVHLQSYSKPPRKYSERRWNGNTGRAASGVTPVPVGQGCAGAPRAGTQRQRRRGLHTTDLAVWGQCGSPWGQELAEQTQSRHFCGSAVTTRPRVCPAPGWRLV